MQNAEPEQIKIGTAIHHAFENFQAVDLALNLSIAFLAFKGSPNCHVIFQRPFREGTKPCHGTRLSVDQPGVKNIQRSMPADNHLVIDPSANPPSGLCRK
jgi:hypothetical protein